MSRGGRVGYCKLVGWDTCTNPVVLGCVVGCAWRYKVDEVVTRFALRRGALGNRSSRRCPFSSDGRRDLLPVR